MKVACNLLKQRLSFFVIQRNFIKHRAVGFAVGDESCSTRGRAQFYPEKKPVGDLIVFKHSERRRARGGGTD